MVSVALVLAAALAAEKPNIVFFLADDFGFSDSSSDLLSGGHGNTYYETPFIDELAEEGMVFTNSHSNGALCAPTRAALHSGQYGTRTNVLTVNSLNRGGSRTLLVSDDSRSTNYLDTSLETLGKTMQNSGYKTAYFGKYHVASSEQQIEQFFGWDENYGGSEASGPYDGYHATSNGEFGRYIGKKLDKYASNYSRRYINTKLKPYARNIRRSWLNQLTGTRKHVTDAIADAALDFLDSHASQPCFLLVSHFAVHTPVDTAQARRDLLQKYNNKPKGPGNSQREPGYGALVEGMDQSIGRVVGYLKETNDPRNPGMKLADNTIVFFTSDNGGRRFFADNRPLKGGKFELNEGGIRVPLLAWSANAQLVKPRSSTDLPVMTVDHYPTLVALAGGVLPNRVMDGVNLESVLKGTADTSLSQRDMFWHLPAYERRRAGEWFQNPQSVVISENIKVIYSYETATYEVYDLNNDIGETRNLFQTGLSAELQTKVSRMTASLHNFLKNTNALLPQRRSDMTYVDLPHIL